MTTRLSAVPDESLESHFGQSGRLQIICAALGNPTRAQLACLASQYPGLSQTELAGLIDVPLSLLCFHVRQLRRAGLLYVEVEGRNHRVYVAAEFHPLVLNLLALADLILG